MKKVVKSQPIKSQKKQPPPKSKPKPKTRFNTEKESIEEIKKGFVFDGETYDLTEQQHLFAMEYVKNNFKIGDAAVAAGYSFKDRNKVGWKVLQIPDVSRLIEKLKNDIGAALGISALDIAREYAKMGFSDIREIFDKNGALIKIKSMSDKAGANIASVEVLEVRNSSGVKIGETKKVKLYDKINALDKLAKMIGVDGVTKIANTKADGTPLDEDVLNGTRILRIKVTGLDKR